MERRITGVAASGTAAGPEVGPEVAEPPRVASAYEVLEQVAETYRVGGVDAARAWTVWARVWLKGRPVTVEQLRLIGGFATRAEARLYVRVLLTAGLLRQRGRRGGDLLYQVRLSVALGDDLAPVRAWGHRLRDAAQRGRVQGLLPPPMSIAAQEILRLAEVDVGQAWAVWWWLLSSVAPRTVEEIAAHFARTFGWVDAQRPAQWQEAQTQRLVDALIQAGGVEASEPVRGGSVRYVGTDTNLDATTAEDAELLVWAG